jgi:FHA domain
MPTCPAGHDSSATDFCDVCGMRIAGPAAGPASQAGASVPAAQAEPCPQCGTERTGQFCEGCGFDFSSATPARAAVPAGTITGHDPAGTAATGSSGQDPAGTAATGSSGQAAVSPPAAGAGLTWTAVVTADRGYFDRVIAAGGPDASTIEFPAYCPERRFPLSGEEMRVGRRSASRGLEPEIDLSGPPADPGISHLHAVLIAQPDGGWSVIDPGSSNGTQVNDTDIETGVAVPLNPGDRINIGAWTVLTLQT